jgi:hypothetical protein
MACVVKQPMGESKGVLVVTDGELRDWLQMSSTLRRSFMPLRSRWIILAHCNSPVEQRHAGDGIIDGYIAGRGDIVWTGSKPLHQIEMDCSNFCPDFFEASPDTSEPFWDLLFISRNQPFKSIGDLFHILRAVFDQAPIRVLAIITVSSAVEMASSEPVKLYTSMFTTAERKYFTLLMPWIDYPFCFDLPTLAHFYRHSRAFLHTAHGERHPRVVGYAWAAGIPVVARPSVAALLPPELACEPGFFAFQDCKQASERIRRAISNRAPLPAAYSQFHLARFQTVRFKDEIEKLYVKLGEFFVDGGWFLTNLDVRLARHHDSRAGTNSSRSSLFQLATMLVRPLPTTLRNEVEADIDNLALLQSDSPAVVREAEAAARRRKHRELYETYSGMGLRRMTEAGVLKVIRFARLAMGIHTSP